MFSKIWDIWRKIYSYILPSIVVVLYIIFYERYGFSFEKSNNFVTILGVTITFVSIIISFFGVLLTILITARDKSEMIRYFMEKADSRKFAKNLKHMILVGLMLICVSALLYMNDIIVTDIIHALILCNIWLFVCFVSLTYRFTGILLSLLIEEKKQ